MFLISVLDGDNIEGLHNNRPERSSRKKREAEPQQAARSLSAYFEKETVTIVVTAVELTEGSSSSVSCKEVESSADFMELARGIEPSNRRRVGPEACLSGSCGGGQPPRTLPTKGTHPLRNP